MIKGTVGTAEFFVQNSATGLGVAGLVAGDFTFIKLVQDGTPGDDIAGSITLVDEGDGWYNFAISGDDSDYGLVKPSAKPSNVAYQVYGVSIYTEALVLSKLDAMIEEV